MTGEIAGVPPPGTPTAEPADRRLLFFGDSFVAGVGDPTGAGWVGRLVAASYAAGLPITAYDLGVRRETSVQVAARWRAEARPRLTPEADCRVVLCVGANDTSEDDEAGGVVRVEPERSEATLAAVLDEAAGLGLPAFVVGPPPLGTEAQQDRVEELSARFESVCVPRRVPFVAVAAALRSEGVWLAEAEAGDGWHPAAGGYSALAEVVRAGGWIDWLRAAPDS